MDVEGLHNILSKKVKLSHVSLVYFVSVIKANRTEIFQSIEFTAHAVTRSNLSYASANRPCTVHRGDTLLYRLDSVKCPENRITSRVAPFALPVVFWLSVDGIGYAASIADYCSTPHQQ